MGDEQKHGTIPAIEIHLTQANIRRHLPYMDHLFGSHPIANLLPVPIHVGDISLKNLVVNSELNLNLSTP